MRVKCLVPQLLLLAGCAALGRTTLKERAEALLTLRRNEHGPRDRIAQAWRRVAPEELTDARLKTYDTRTLELLFEALDAAHEALGEDALLRRMEAVFRECLEHRHGFVGRMPESLHRAYVSERDWPRARTLYDELGFKDLALPEIAGAAQAGSPAVYDLSEDGRRMTLRPVELSSGSLIVSVVSPGCHFSQDAEKAIAADPELTGAFSARGLAVDPSTFDLATEGLAAANRDGVFRYTVLHKAAGWPAGMDFGGTPNFYFMRDGRIVHAVEGFRKDRGDAGRLREGVRKLANP